MYSSALLDALRNVVKNKTHCFCLLRILGSIWGKYKLPQLASSRRHGPGCCWVVSAWEVS